jgi:hypothetical protein
MVVSSSPMTMSNMRSVTQCGSTAAASEKGFASRPSEAAAPYAPSDTENAEARKPANMVPYHMSLRLRV